MVIWAILVSTERTLFSKLTTLAITVGLKLLVYAGRALSFARTSRLYRPTGTAVSARMRATPGVARIARNERPRLSIVPDAAPRQRPPAGCCGS